MKILVVDDTRIILSVVEAILAQDRHEVFTACDGRDGHRAFGDLRPEMVITDIEMPWLDGLSMMASIRRIQPDVLTLYMTGNPGPYQQRLREERGAWGAGLLNKPFTRSELLCRVAEVVSQAPRIRKTQAPRIPPAFIKTSPPRPRQNDVASLSSAHFQREKRYEVNARGYADGLYFDGIRAGGRG